MAIGGGAQSGSGPSAVVHHPWAGIALLSVAYRSIPFSKLSVPSTGLPRALLEPRGLRLQPAPAAVSWRALQIAVTVAPDILSGPPARAAAALTAAAAASLPQGAHLIAHHAAACWPAKWHNDPAAAAPRPAHTHIWSARV